MSCTLKFADSLIKVEFCSAGDKQKILVDVLTKYSEMNINKLASILEVSEETLKNVCNGDGFLTGEPADNLSQLFLMFFSKNFFRNCTLIRKFN